MHADVHQISPDLTREGFIIHFYHPAAAAAEEEKEALFCGAYTHQGEERRFLSITPSPFYPLCIILYTKPSSVYLSLYPSFFSQMCAEKSLSPYPPSRTFVSPSKKRNYHVRMDE